MLDKIKVYNRKTGIEVRDDNINYFNLSFTADNKITLQVNNRFYPLLKTDPLNKFKKEIEGWWFCEEYIVLEGEEYAKLECEIDYNAHRKILFPNDDKVYMHITFQGKKIKSLCSNIEQDITLLQDLYSISKELYPNERIVDGYKFVIPYSIMNRFLSISEDTYLKLLELINQ
jgi:hypothetical protein